MDKIRLSLTLITIAITVGPILGIMVAYRNNLLGLIIPPEIDQVVSDLENMTNPNRPEGSISDIFPEPLGPEDLQYDPASRTFTITTKIKNPLPFDATLSSITGTLECDDHHFALGEIALKDPVNMKTGETATATITGQWTDAALNHFDNSHAGEQSLSTSLVDSTINVAGMTVQYPDRIILGDIPIIT
ncbi:MAG TPA: hypothetical protein VF893_05685 [Candidatus Bathyarchaeia archaeon]